MSSPPKEKYAVLYALPSANISHETAFIYSRLSFSLRRIVKLVNLQPIISHQLPSPFPLQHRNTFLTHLAIHDIIIIFRQTLLITPPQLSLHSPHFTPVLAFITTRIIIQRFQLRGDK